MTTGRLITRFCPPGLSGALLAVFVLVAACSAIAADDPQPAVEDEPAVVDALSWGYEADYNPRYVWRGIAYSEGAVSQNSVWMTAKGNTFGVWANTNLESVDGRNTNEVDYYVSRELAWGKLTVEPMLQYYTYRHQEDSPATGEVDIKFSLPLGKTTLFSTQTLDVMEYAGAYFGDVGLSLGKEFSERLEMESTVSLGWGSGKFNETYIGPRKWALNLASFDLGVTYTAANGLYWRPHVSYTRLLDGELRDEIDDSSILNLGLAVGMEF